MAIRKNGRIPFEEPPKATRGGAPFVTWRLMVLAAGLMVVLGVLGVRIYYLTVLRGPYFYELSENNFLFERQVVAPRGRILTADGIAIALNRTLYQIHMSPLRVEEEEIVRIVGRIAAMVDRPELSERASEVIAMRPRWKTVQLARDLKFDSVAPLLERQYEFPGVIIEPQYTRDYPYGALLGHITGYTAPITKKELESRIGEGYLRNARMGKIGVEGHYESELRDRHGMEILVRDAHGRPRSSYIEVAAVRGADVILTIDLTLQRIADKMLEGERGSVLIMDPRDGAILALVSKPDYDPNHPLRGSATGETSSFNKVTRGRFAPASTFKIVTASAGLLSGRTPGDVAYCDGTFFLDNVETPFFCGVKTGHGRLNMHQAIVRSCNVYFYGWAESAGRDRMLQTAHAFGFGRPTGVDIKAEGKGLLALPGVQRIYKGSVIQMGIGQGALILTTPLQLLAAYAALCNGGVRYQPHVLKEIRYPDGKVAPYEPKVLGELPLSEQQRRVLLAGFRAVVQEEGGTGYGKGFQRRWDIAGKTGSAEVAGQELTNGFFVGYAPSVSPEMCMLVLIEGKGHGGVTAVPVAAKLMAAYFDGVDPEQPTIIVKRPEDQPDWMFERAFLFSRPAWEDDRVPQWAARRE